MCDGIGPILGPLLIGVDDLAASGHICGVILRWPVDFIQYTESGHLSGGRLYDCL